MNTRSVQFRIASWYTGLLAAFLILFGIAVYVGLRSYLERTVRASLSEQAEAVVQEIAEHDAQGRSSSIASLLTERFAPQLNNRFIRVTAGGDRVLFASPRTSDGLLDPAAIPRLAHDAGQEYGTTAVLPDKHRVLVQVLPALTKDGVILVEVGSMYAPIEQILTGLLLTIVIGFPILVGLAIVGGRLLTRRALSPLRVIAIHAERISSANLFERMPVVTTGDELEQLTLAVNKMMGRLESAFEHVNRFSADVSHELRTPLTILRGELEAAVQDERLTPELLDLIGSALEETERMRTIVEQLLTISRLDAGETPMQRVDVNLGDLVTAVADQMRALAEEKAITLRCEGPEPVETRGDASRLKQVVVNLLDNAIRYTQHSGSITVKVARDVNWGVLSVSDNGCGIAPGALPHVFERFYRADKARTRYAGGAGLGLSIVKAICSAHQGEVKISSTEGVGTTVVVRLPVNRATERMETLDSERQYATTSSTSS